jgi:GT2 family glycosyltransferase
MSSTLKQMSLVTVSYNSEKTIYKLLSSIKAIDYLIKEIIVIDNNSHFLNIKKIKKISSKIKIIQNKENVGFAKAVNQGIKISKSKIILLLNPDTYLIDKSLVKTFDVIKNNPKIGAIGGKIFDKNKNRKYTATNNPTFLTGLFEFTNLKKLFPNNYFSKAFWAENEKISRPTNIVSLCGAYIILRKKINNKLNLFDEKYFLYMEDIDFGISINKSGYKVVFDPKSQIIHIGGVSSQNKYHTDLKNWYKSRKIFFKKHLNPIQSIILISIFNLEEKILKIRQYIHHDSK